MAATNRYDTLEWRLNTWYMDKLTGSIAMNKADSTSQNNAAQATPN
jgi:hypothetical protein